MNELAEVERERFATELAHAIRRAESAESLLRAAVGVISDLEKSHLQIADILDRFAAWKSS